MEATEKEDQENLQKLLLLLKKNLNPKKTGNFPVFFMITLFPSENISQNTSESSIFIAFFLIVIS